LPLLLLLLPKCAVGRVGTTAAATSSFLLAPIKKIEKQASAAAESERKRRFKVAVPLTYILLLTDRDLMLLVHVCEEETGVN
jgi:hypothetical protein